MNGSESPRNKSGRERKNLGNWRGFYCKFKAGRSMKYAKYFVSENWN